MTIPTKPRRKQLTATASFMTSTPVYEDQPKPYVIAGEIGSGSFATVYKGFHENSHQQVAIKAVKRQKLSHKLLDNLHSEIRVLKALAHRHITKLYDTVQTEHHIYLIMEYCSGGDLSNYIKKRGRVDTLEYSPTPGSAPQYYPHPRSGGLDEVVVRSFLRQLARALKFLREQNLIHRDIKPQNLLLNPPSPEELSRGHPLGVPILKVADFGFARFLPNAMLAETLCGSPLYMAPEILKNLRYDAKVDLWSVGAVLYEMAVGKAPFKAMNHVELLSKIQNSKGIRFPDEDPERKNRQDLPRVPEDIKKLIRTLLKQLPVERASFDDFFGSTAVAKSRNPRRLNQTSLSPAPTTLLQAPSASSGNELRTPDHGADIPPEILDANVMIPPSRFHFRTPTSVSKTPPPTDAGRLSEKKAFRAVSSPSDRLPCPSSTESSLIPGESEEDGILRREYVMVGDVRALEFNRAIDELASPIRHPLNDLGRRPIAVVSPAPETPTYTTFPPPRNPTPQPISSSPSSIASRAATNALNRAISLASRKLFGVNNTQAPQATDKATPSLVKDPALDEVPLTGNYLEGDLLASLENLAQKTDVLTNWADEMYEFVKAVPQKPLSDPTKFNKRRGEGEKTALRRQQGDAEVEYNALACVAVYMLLMAFSQKGIDQLRRHQDEMMIKHPGGDFTMSEGFHEALSWFKDHFLKCHERAGLVQSWLPRQNTGAATPYLDQLVYDRALALSRKAARKELLDQASTRDECEKLYKESLWCLYALQDDLLQKGNPFSEEDKITISNWIVRTKVRLIRCQARMAMNDQDRLSDARTDQNLVDVARIPAPWDAKAQERTAT